MAALIFHFLNLKKIKPIYKAAWRHKKQWFLIMLWVSLMWIATFLGSAINTALFILIYFTTNCLLGFINKTKKAASQQKRILIFSLTGLIATTAFYLYIQLTPNNTLKNWELIGFGMLGGLCNYLYQAESYKFSQTSFLSATAILAIRFWLLILFSLLLTPFAAFTQLSFPNDILLLILIALLSLVIPIYAGQKGVLALGPELNAIICGFTPAATYLFGLLFSSQDFELSPLLLNLSAAFFLGLPFLWQLRRK